MKCKTQKEAFRVVAERDDQAGWWKCADCGRILRTLRAHNFAHIKSKGKYPELKCETENIVIKCYTCHCNNDHNQNVKNAEWLDQ
jgi:hypothetical protein